MRCAFVLFPVDIATSGFAPTTSPTRFHCNI